MPLHALDWLTLLVVVQRNSAPEVLWQHAEEQRAGSKCSVDRKIIESPRRAGPHTQVQSFLPLLTYQISCSSWPPKWVSFCLSPAIDIFKHQCQWENIWNCLHVDLLGVFSASCCRWPDLQWVKPQGYYYSLKKCLRQDILGWIEQFSDFFKDSSHFLPSSPSSSAFWWHLPIRLLTSWLQEDCINSSHHITTPQYSK